MTLMLRLQRHGRKSRPFYHIVATDIRSPRDGRFKEKLGYYDPNREPSVIEINAPRLQHYYRNGAQVSDAVRNLTRIKKIALSRGKQEESVTAKPEAEAQDATQQEAEATARGLSTSSEPASERYKKPRTAVPDDAVETKLEAQDTTLPENETAVPDDAVETKLEAQDTTLPENETAVPDDAVETKLEAQDTTQQEAEATARGLSTSSEPASERYKKPRTDVP